MKKLKDIKIAGLSLPLLYGSGYHFSCCYCYGKITTEHGGNYLYVSCFRSPLLFPW